MGNEIAQQREWDHDRSLDWHLLEQAAHAGVQTLVRDLNNVYRETPALHEVDFDPSGFEWIDYSDRDNSVLSWIRRDRSGGFVVVVTNLTPIARENYSIGVPASGTYTELLNTDSERYGGSGISNAVLQTTGQPQHGRPDSLILRLPALATLFIKPENGN
jgi:1,4-alpha-glucan branching enzyme